MAQEVIKIHPSVPFPSRACFPFIYVVVVQVSTRVRRLHPWHRSTTCGCCCTSEMVEPNLLPVGVAKKSKIKDWKFMLLLPDYDYVVSPGIKDYIWRARELFLSPFPPPRCCYIFPWEKFIS